MAAATTTAATSTSTMIADSAATISAVPDASDLDTHGVIFGFFDDYAGAVRFFRDIADVQLVQLSLAHKI